MKLLILNCDTQEIFVADPTEEERQEVARLSEAYDETATVVSYETREDSHAERS